jgi:uncharacterized protein (TIGR02246 family)
MAKRRLLWLLGTLLALAGTSVTMSLKAEPAVDDVAAIRQVLVLQQQASNRGDIDGFMRGYKDAPDTTFVGSSVRKGYRALLDNYRKHYASKAEMGSLTFSALDVRLLADSAGGAHYAVVTGRFHLDRDSHGEAPQDDGVFSLVWERTPDGWKIILDHTS